jgi:hypothetical protein
MESPRVHGCPLARAAHNRDAQPQRELGCVLRAPSEEGTNKGRL